MQNPNPNFSVYDLFMEDGQSIDIFSEKRRMLALWCANIERTIVDKKLQSAHVFAGFQQMEFFLPVIERYQQMAQHVENIWIFGTPANQQTLPTINGIHYVYLQPQDALTHEWFLLVNHPTYSRSLSAIETTTPGMPHSKREFKGILSSSPTMIAPIFEKVKATMVTS